MRAAVGFRPATTMHAMRVLVVEDEPKLAGLLPRGLGEEGHPTDVAATARTPSGWPGEHLRRDRPRRDAARASTGSRFARAPRATASGRRCSCSPRVTRSTTASRASTSAPTTTSSSRSRSPSCSRGCARSTRRGAGRAADRASRRRLRLDPAARRAWRGDTEIELSAKEFALLEVFMRAPGRGAVAPRAARARRGTWRTRTARTSSTCTCATCARSRPAVRRRSLETVRGVGYRLRESG